MRARVQDHVHGLLTYMAHLGVRRDPLDVALFHTGARSAALIVGARHRGPRGAGGIDMSDAEDDSEVMKVEDMSAKANEDLARLCGSEEMASRVKKLWEDLMDKKRLDVSKEKLSDTEIGMVLKGLYSMARTTGFQTERMKPLPITELDFSGNELTAKGIDEVVQFARTAGANASLVDLSDNRLDDAATNELARLVKNYNSFASQKLLGELLLNGNEIGS